MDLDSAVAPPSIPLPAETHPSVQWRSWSCPLAARGCHVHVFALSTASSADCLKSVLEHVLSYHCMTDFINVFANARPCVLPDPGSMRSLYDTIVYHIQRSLVRRGKKDFRVVNVDVPLSEGQALAFVEGCRVNCFGHCTVTMTVSRSPLPLTLLCMSVSLFPSLTVANRSKRRAVHCTVSVCYLIKSSTRIFE